MINHLHPHSRFKLVISVIPILFGFISLLLGADTNWDLTNYHIYNPYAWLNNKIAIDLAPAGLQTYFNPLLDAPYFLLTAHWPAPVAGFLMGVFHGFSFSLVALIARHMLIQYKIEKPNKTAIILATFGCLTGNFISEIGTTMGDATTAVIVLSGVYISLLSQEQQARKQQIYLLASGLLLGAATGLKLINSCFALALSVSLFLTPGSFLRRLEISTIYSIGVTLGLMLTGGWWFMHMYELFGNPLFPQYSSIFPHELTQNIMGTNSRWGPTNWWEILIWPIIISINPLRAGELSIHQFIWPAFFIALLIYFHRSFFSTKPHQKWQNHLPITTILLGFLIIGFVISTLIFGVQRYLISLELLVPTGLYWLISKITYPKRSHQISLVILTTLTSLSLITIPRTWGHAPWSDRMYNLDVPTEIEANSDTVIFAGGDHPFGWMATQFPKELAFIQIGGNFPENHESYLRRVHQILDQRGGNIFAIFPGAKPPTRTRQVEKLDNLAAFFGLSNTHEGCTFLKWSLSALHLQNKIYIDELNHQTKDCQLKANITDLPAELEDNNLLQLSASALLLRYNLQLVTSSCRLQSAFIGKENFPYHWCQVQKNL